MSQSEIAGSAAGAAGFAFYSYGTNIVISNPWSSFRWSFYTGAISERGGVDQGLQDLFIRSGIAFNDEPYDTAPGSIQGVKGTIAINNLNHAAAVRAEVERIAGSDSIFGQIRTTAVSPGMINENGFSRILDIGYQTRSFLYGASNNYVEVKTGVAEFRGTKGGTPAVEARADAANLAELNGRVAGIRTIGQGLRIGGVALGAAGAAYDIYSTGSTIAGQLSAGNASAAALSSAEFGGRWTGTAVGEAA